MPLSVHGLWEAEITTPASYFRERARYATPGVVITPALCTATPTELSPSATRSAIHPLDWRVSWPITTRALRFERIRSCPRARPMRYVLSSVRGNSPATPRIPSVPKSCLLWVVMLVVWVSVRRRRILHGHNHVNRPGINHLHHRIGNVSVSDKTISLHGSTHIDGVCNRRLDCFHPLLRTGDLNARWIHFNLRDLPSR